VCGKGKEKRGGAGKEGRGVFVQSQEVREDLGGVKEGGKGVDDWEGGVHC